MKLQDLQGDHVAAAYVPGQATAGTADSWPVFVAPRACTITGIQWVPAAAVAGAATNNFALAAQNAGQAGAGTTALTTTKTYASGTDSVANDAEDLTLTATTADLDLASGDVVKLVRTVNGTGLAMPDGLVRVLFKFR